MATPTWNQIAAPNFGAGNYLIAQAMEQLSKATTGFKSIADQYKDTVQKRNLGLIQEYVNSVKTPEELQSEAFKTGLDNITRNMGGDYDTLAKAQLVDKAYDSLLSRKANQVSISRNEFGLTQDQLEANQKQAISNIFAINDPAMRQAAIDQAVKDKVFDSSKYYQTLNAELGGIANQQTIDYNKATEDMRKEALRLGNVSTEHAMKIADRNAATAEMNANTNRLQAEAAAAKAEAEKKAKQNEKNPALLLLSGIDKVDKTYASEKLKPDNNPDTLNTLEDWWNKNNTWAKSDTDLDNIKNAIETDPKLSRLSGREQVFIAETSFQAIKNQNTLGRNILPTEGNRKQAVELVKKTYTDMVNKENDYLYSQKIPLYRDAVRQYMIQTGSRDPVKAALAVGMNEYEMYRTNIRTPLQNMAESVYESSGSKLPKEQFVDKFIYRSVNKEPVDDLIKPKQEATSVPAQSSNTVLNTLGTGSYEDKVTLLRSELEKTRDPIQIAFLNNELKKLEKGVPSSVSDPSQEPSALAAQEQRLQDQAKQRLINAGVTTNTSKSKAIDKAATAEAKEVKQSVFTDTPLKVLADTVKPGETKPRVLTPAEEEQGERMNKAALARLVGAKLEEKRAEVQKQFPGTPLKQIAKAATPVPSPLIPVESQNAFRVKENNLTLDFRTGKSTPTKDPVPMPKVTWKEPVQAVTINPIYAQLPQHKVVATFVPDGDTINATSDSYKTKGERARKAGGIICRIDSIEAPETAKPQYGKKGQPYGEEAAKILQQMVLNKEVSIRVTEPTDGESNYGRDVCQIEVAGKDVSVELLRAGAAWLYREYNHYGQGGFDLESNARQSKLGLWGLPNPVYPSDFRHNGNQNP